MVFYSEQREVYTFPQGISTIVNVLVQMKFELTYFEATVQHYSSLG